MIPPPRLNQKYTPAKCSKTAKFLSEPKGATNGAADPPDGDSDGPDEEPSVWMFFNSIISASWNKVYHRPASFRHHPTHLVFHIRRIVDPSSEVPSPRPPGATRMTSPPPRAAPPRNRSPTPDARRTPLLPPPPSSSSTGPHRATLPFDETLETPHLANPFRLCERFATRKFDGIIAFSSVFICLTDDGMWRCQIPKQ